MTTTSRINDNTRAIPERPKERLDTLAERSPA
jgi:hypothetical protein